MQAPQPELKRTLTLRTVVSTSAGLTFASSTFLVVVQVANYLVGDSSWIAILIAGVLCALAAAAFSEVTGMWPSVSGIRPAMQRAFGEKLSLVINLTYMSVVTLVVGTEAYVLSYVLHEALPAITAPWWIFLMLTLATAVNIRGIKLTGRLQDIVTFLVVGSILSMSVFALSHRHIHLPQLVHTGGIGPLFQAVGVAIFLFVGFEWVTPLADEVRSVRSIPIGMFIAIGILTFVYAMIATAMFAPGSEAGRAMLFGTDAAREAIPHVKFAAMVLGPSGRLCMILTSILMSLTTFNAGLLGISRFIYGMARDHVFPKSFSTVSARFNTPVMSVIVVYVIALIVSALVYWTKHYVLLVNLAAASESFIYGFAAICLIVLRFKAKDQARPFRMIGGIALPLITAILFLIIGIGVFVQPGVEYWGAAVILAATTLAWWIYIHFFAMPRIQKRRDAARKGSRRPRGGNEPT